MSFSKTIKIARAEGRVQFEVFESRVYVFSNVVCVGSGVMYSGEYDACDVILSVYPHRASNITPTQKKIMITR
jgi:hypothetical protein